MAHVAKYKAPAVGHMMAHYRREGRVPELRENIDESRTAQNYSFHVGKGQDGKLRFLGGGSDAGEVRRRVSAVEQAGGRKVRKDAVVLADMVITAPADVRREDLRKFFQVSYWYLAKQVGSSNMLGGYVHMDEMAPHMHAPFTPITRNKKGKPTFSYKSLCPRSFYQQFHKGLGDELEKRLGYRPSVELSEEQKEERVYTERTEDIDTARATMRMRVVEPVEEERDQVRAEVDGLRARKTDLSADILDLQRARERAERAKSDAEAQALEAAKRLEGLRQACDECEGVAERLESAVADARGFEDAGRAGKLEILSRIGGKLAGLADEAGGAARRLGAVFAALFKWPVMRLQEAARAQIASTPRQKSSFSNRIDSLRGVSVPDPSRGRGYGPPTRPRGR